MSVRIPARCPTTGQSASRRVRALSKTFILALGLSCGLAAAAAGQCRLLDRTTHLNPVPLVAEEFNYAVPGQVLQYSAGGYDPRTPGNWGSSREFVGRWGNGKAVLPTNWDAEPGRATTHYYSPAAFEMTTDGTLKINATALTPAYPYRGGNPRTVFYRTGRLVADPDSGSSVGRLLTYGLYEVRCKFPQNPLASQRGLMPTFWVIGGASELDVFDQVDGTSSARLNSAVLDWTNSPATVSAGNLALKHGPDLAAGFNVFGMLWTPQGVTFLLNDRAYYHVPARVLPTHPGLMRLYLELRTTDLAISTGQGPQTSRSVALLDRATLEVDYIRVYGLKNPATAHAAYLTAQEYGHHALITNPDSRPVPSHQEYVGAASSSIAVNPADADEVFFIGTDNAIYQATRAAAPRRQWAGRRLDAPDQGLHRAWQPASDLVYNPKLRALIYRGADNRIQQYRQRWAGGPWQHSYVLPGNGPGAAGIAGPNCLAVVANGDLFFIAPDSTISWYRHQAAGGWVRYPMPHPGGAKSTQAAGNLTVMHTNGATAVFYQGRDNKLQQFWWNADHYVHAYVGPPGSPDVRAQPGGVVAIPHGEVFYVDQSNGLHQLHFAAGWHRAQLPLRVLPAGNLAWDEVNQQVVYVDLRGGLQGIRAGTGGVWAGVAIDAHFPNTDQFQTFIQGSSPSGSSSVAAGPAGDIFYRAHDAELHYFVREACDVFTAPGPGNTQSTLSQLPGRKARGTMEAMVRVGTAPKTLLPYSAPVRPPSTGTLVPLM